MTSRWVKQGTDLHTKQCRHVMYGQGVPRGTIYTCHRSCHSCGRRIHVT